MNPKTTKKSPSILEKEPKVNAHYRKAILHAMEKLHDYQSRSNMDAIRRHCQDALEAEQESDHRPASWNEVLFLKTFKTVIKDGEVEKCTNASAALSPEYKRKRADSLSKRMEEHKESMLLPPLTGFRPIESIKDAPKRRSEHEKWKIIPKTIYDKSTVVNPMDTH